MGGGLEVSPNAEVLAGNAEAISGLWAMGEVAGGIHGNNRLGGNSLLDCVVFGRVAAKHACKYTFGADSKYRLCPVPRRSRSSRREHEPCRGAPSRDARAFGKGRQ